MIRETTITETVATLVQSETGADAAKDLLRFLQRRGSSLDTENQRRVAFLLLSAWSGRPATVIEELRKFCGIES